jgi:hypothetical protein
MSILAYKYTGWKMRRRLQLIDFQPDEAPTHLDASYALLYTNGFLVDGSTGEATDS